MQLTVPSVESTYAQAHVVKYEAWYVMMIIASLKLD